MWKYFETILFLYAYSILQDCFRIDSLGFWYNHCHVSCIMACACVLSHFSHIWLFATPWTVDHQTLHIYVYKHWIVLWFFFSVISQQMKTSEDLNHSLNWLCSSDVENHFVLFITSCLCATCELYWNSLVHVLKMYKSSNLFLWNGCIHFMSRVLLPMFLFLFPTGTLIQNI